MQKKSAGKTNRKVNYLANIKGIKNKQFRVKKTELHVIISESKMYVKKKKII